MRKVKYSIFILAFLASLFLIFTPEVIPENFQPNTILDKAADSDVIIIFNSGGWGNTPLEEADDFIPIIQGIQETLDQWGYHSIVIPYNRTKDSFLGKVSGAKNIFTFYQKPSKDLADKIDYLAKGLPGKKIIITGLSNGAVFAAETYEKVSEDVKGSVYALLVGTPFWEDFSQSDNILELNNNEKDKLAKGDIMALLSTFIKAPFKWFTSKFNGENLSFSRAFQVFGHEYSWSSSDVGPRVVTFLENQFR